MPTYAYGCDKCGFRFDKVQGFDDPPLTECPECGEDALRKLITPVGIVFKGSGFYSTDHRSPSGQGSSRKADEAAAPAKGDDAAKGEAAKPTKAPKKVESSAED